MRSTHRRPLLIPAVLAAAFACALTVLRRRSFAVEVAGDSMAPALRAGDFVLVVRRPLPHDEAAFGLVVCLRRPDGRLLLKRVIGLPGEALRIGAAVQVNGRPLHEPYAHGDTPPDRYRGISRLRDTEYLVLGDNRVASTDSRDFGPVDASQALGIAWLRYWPPERFGLVPRPPRTFTTAARSGVSG